MHNHCFRFRTCYRCKIWASLRKFSPLVSQAGYVSVGDCYLVTSVSYFTRVHDFSVWPIRSALIRAVSV